MDSPNRLTDASDPIVVLLVDDQPLVGALVKRSLAEAADVEFHHCLDPRKAVEQANQIQPTVILQDLVMPEMDGLTLVGRFRANAATLNTPIIVLSTREEPATKSDSFSAGANDYLVKLPDKVELIARIRYHSKAYTNLLQRDLAEKTRREMEVQLRQAQKLESVGQLAAGMAHEINTPMQFLMDNVRFLKTAFDDLNKLLATYKELELAAEAKGLPRDNVKLMEESIDLAYLRTEVPTAIDQSIAGLGRVTSLVKAMKEFSLCGTDDKTATDLNKSIETTLAVSRHEWSSVAEVVTNFDRSLPTISCLPAEMNQVLVNLIVNAAHAIEERKDGKGTITMSTARSNNSVEIRISDTGTGIPADVRDKIFDPFFTTKDVGKGRGQGLTIAHSVVVGKHGGTITFETEPGKGTTFIVRLPLET